MPFCTKCGSEVQGRFCVKCGSPVAGVAAPPPAPPMAAAAPPVMPGAAPVKKGTSPLVWILVAVLGLFMLIGIGIVGAGIFFVHKVKQAGFDPELMKKNPGLAVTKMIAAANPDLEVVRVDESRGVITLREKSTGKTTTVDFDAVKEGHITFKDDKGESVTFSGDSGKMEVKSSTGETFKMGSGADVKSPPWIPSYPGAQVEGKFARQGADGEAGAFGFKTQDPVKNVLAFYSQGLKAAGLNISSQFTQDSGDSPGGMLTAEDNSKQRTAVVTVGTESGATTVSVTYSVKK